MPRYILSAPKRPLPLLLPGTLPIEVGDFPEIDMPDKFIVNDNMILPPLPPEEAKKLKRDLILNRRRSFAAGRRFPERDYKGRRQYNRPYYACRRKDTASKAISRDIETRLRSVDRFYEGKSYGGGFIVGGENYGQGSAGNTRRLLKHPDKRNCKTVCQEHG